MRKSRKTQIYQRFAAFWGAQTQDVVVSKTATNHTPEKRQKKAAKCAEISHFCGIFAGGDGVGDGVYDVPMRFVPQPAGCRKRHPLQIPPTACRSPAAKSTFACGEVSRDFAAMPQNLRCISARKTDNRWSSLQIRSDPRWIP